MPAHADRIAVVLLAGLLVSLMCSCGHPPVEDASNAADSQKLPFDRPASTTGISPSQSLIPSATRLPEGTTLVVRLQGTLSSVSAHAGDSFDATFDEAVVIDGQTLVARGTTATGRVVEARPAASVRESSRDSSPEGSHETGYLRIVLVSLNAGGRAIGIETSSVFAKGGSREERKPASGAVAGTSAKSRDRSKDVVLGSDRRLSFRVAQSVDLH